MTYKRALCVLVFAPLFGCGQQPGETVENKITEKVAPVVVRQCDEECKRVAQHRENQRRKSLDSAF